VHGHNPATVHSKSRPNRRRQCSQGRIKFPGLLNKKQGWAMSDKKSDWLAREREEIAARVASFRATQKKFEKEREEYYETTLSNAWDGFHRPHFWT
jgi:hypothetical protein